MEADLILRALEAELAPAIASAGGTLEVCGTPADTLEQLTVSPKNFRIILQWGGEDNTLHRGAAANMHLQAVVQATRGFKLHAGADVYQDRTEGRDNFIQLCAVTRELIRRVNFTTPGGECHPHVHCDGFVPQSTHWMGGGLDELQPVREAVLTFVIQFALNHCELQNVVVT